MSLVADLVSWLCILVGAAVALIGGLGILRLPDVFARMHGAGMIDTLGLGLILIGLMFQAGVTLVTGKLILLLVVILFTSPVATHALARACLHGRLQPLAERKEPGGDQPSKH